MKERDLMTTKAEYESPELNAAQQGWLGLQERVCVVTGAASGIGAAIAASLADVVARVAVLDRDVAGAQQRASALRERGAQAIAVSCDISDAESVAAAAERVHVELGTPYASINLTGYLLSARAFSPAMRKAGQGAIVNVASIAGVFPQTGSGAYSASKAGVLLLSRQMAVEWGPDGVRSNAICPGMIRTALSAKFYEEPGFEAKRAAVTANRRIGEPQDIADVALFLASPRSAYVNGAELLVDGGMANMLMDMVPRPGFNRAA